MIICRKFRGKDCVIEFDYKITNGGCHAQTYGPPENCYPAEPMEYEITTIYSVRDDVLGETRPELVLTEAERAEIMEWLETDEKVYEQIAGHEPDYPDYNDYYGD